ncbi:MAG: cyclic nucleotide-binding domain-containing protein [Alphaproteobacteria bacterium]|nr:cyclic nucleotide-binding domain-containing protein [Alphaproteobacteria bacterium]
MASHDTIILERRFIPEGTLVMRQGDPGNCAYLIQSGTVSVYTEKDGKKVEHARLGAGEIFGEMALVFDEPRSASVKAVKDTSLIILTREAFKQKLNKTDPTIKAIVGMLIKRVGKANEKLAAKN